MKRRYRCAHQRCGLWKTTTSVNTGTPARGAGGTPRPNRPAGSAYASVSSVALDLMRA